MIVAVFFPSLMGVGIIISGTLLVSDWVRTLLPKGSLRRKHNVVVGTYGVVGDAVDAAGYHLSEPWFINRGLRQRSTYLVITAVTIAGGIGAIWSGLLFFDDPLGLFYRSPWAIGIGYGVGIRHRESHRLWLPGSRGVGVSYHLRHHRGIWIRHFPVHGNGGFNNIYHQVDAPIRLAVRGI